jgi:hypothetical protein
MPPARNNGVVGRGNKEYAIITIWLLHPFSFIILPRNSTSSFFDLLKILPAKNGIYKVRIYLPRIDPTTPITITDQMFKSNIICKKTMMVKAGGKGKGTTSNNKAPIKTNRYGHHIFLIFYGKRNLNHRKAPSILAL